MAVTGADSSFLGQDDDGPFLWVYVLALGLLTPLHSAAQDVPTAVGYVTDLSLADDPQLVPEKVRWIGTGWLDVDGEDLTAARQADELDEPASAPTAAPAPATVESTPEQALADSRGNTTRSGGHRHAMPDATHSSPLADYIAEGVDRYLVALASLAGAHFSDAIPRAVQLMPGQPLPDDVPAYLVEGTQLRYHSVHPTDGWYWRTTEDPDMLVYWILDDIVRSLANRWARTAPAAAGMDRVQVGEQLWVPYWLTLLAGLNPRWRDSTRRFIDTTLRRPAPQRVVFGEAAATFGGGRR